MLSEVGSNKGPRSDSAGDNQSPGPRKAKAKAKAKEEGSGLPPRLLTVGQAAQYLGGISVWTIRALAWRGGLPAVRFGRRLLFDVRDLDALITRQKRLEQS